MRSTDITLNPEGYVSKLEKYICGRVEQKTLDVLGSRRLAVGERKGNENQMHVPLSTKGFSTTIRYSAFPRSSDSSPLKMRAKFKAGKLTQNKILKRPEIWVSAYRKEST